LPHLRQANPRLNQRLAHLRERRRVAGTGLSIEQIA
jgi:cell division protein ZapA (FtsZ GTPase activity inhibitor)